MLFMINYSESKQEMLRRKSKAFLIALSSRKMSIQLFFK